MVGGNPNFSYYAYYAAEFHSYNVPRRMNAGTAMILIEDKLDELGIRHRHVYGMEGDPYLHLLLETSLPLRDLTEELEQAFGKEVGITITTKNPDEKVEHLNGGRDATIKGLFLTY